MRLCISPRQLEKGIARHIQELSSSNDTREPEDVSTWLGPSWTIFFGQSWGTGHISDVTQTSICVI